MRGLRITTSREGRKMDHIYQVRLNYEERLREIEKYRQDMQKHHYTGWELDLASDVRCAKKLAREDLEWAIARIKSEVGNVIL
jgi:hypothetical protein